MALSDTVKERISAQRLIELTNPQDPDALAIDDALLDDASSDVEGFFETEANVTYDDTYKKHRALGTTGVVLKLFEWAGRIEPESDQWAAWISRLEGLARVTSRNRNLPKPQFRADDTEAFFRPREFDAIIPSFPREGRDRASLD